MTELTPESREADEIARLKGLAAWKAHTALFISHYAGLASGGATLRAPDAKILGACMKAELVHRQAMMMHLRALSLDLPEHLRGFHDEQAKMHRRAAEELGHLADKMKEAIGGIAGIAAWFQAVNSVLDEQKTPLTGNELLKALDVPPLIDHLDGPRRRSSKDET